MTYSRRELYALGEPFGESATRLKVDGSRIYGGGGGNPVERLYHGAVDTVTDVFHDVVDGIGDVAEDIGDSLRDVGDSINDAVNDIIPGGWTTLAEVAISFTPLGVMGAAGFGALSGGTHGFKDSKFDLSGAVMGGIQGYGIASLATSVGGAGITPDLADVAVDNSDIMAEPVYDGEVVKNNVDIENFDPVNADPVQTADINLEGGAPPADTNFPSDPSSGLNEYTDPNSALNRGADASMGNNTFAGRAGMAGQGLQNLVGLGPAGTAGIMPAASAINAGMSTMAYAGLGSVAVQTLMEKQAKNDADHQSGKIDDAEYLKNKEMIDASIASAQEAVNQYPYEALPEETPQQEALYPRKQRTLYAQNTSNNEDGGYGYSYGGTVNGSSNQDTSMDGNLTNGFNFNMGGQTPAYGLENLGNGYAKGGWVERYAAGDFLNQHLTPIIRPTVEEVKSQEAQQAKDKAAADLAAAKPMRDHPYESISQTSQPSQSNSKDYEYYGPLLFSQKRSGLGGYEPPEQYASGGEARFLSGGGDGMSDSIRASIDGNQEARLADGEFVIPADVVSHIGNGSSKAGAKQLHAMMERVRKARTGNHKQGKQINPTKFMPA